LIFFTIDHRSIVAAFCLSNELLQFTEFIASQAGSLNKMRDQRNNGTLCDSIHKMIELPLYAERRPSQAGQKTS
jgi:hypothetical protein